MRCGARALDAAMVCQIPVQIILAGSGESKQLQRQLIAQFENEIARLEIRLSISCLTATQRLADFIARLAGSASQIRLPMSHREIGNYLRLTPETVSRLFAKFQHCRWVSMHGREIIICDSAALK